MSERRDFKRWVIDLCFEAQQGLCSKCGVSLESEPYHAHHKNKDNTDNSLTNIELLCVKCHHGTYAESAYEKHKAQEVKTLIDLNKLIDSALDPASKISGAALEKLLEAMTLALRVSRNATEVDYGAMRTPASIKLQRSMADQDARLQSFMDGVMYGVKKTLEVKLNV